MVTVWQPVRIWPRWRSEASIRQEGSAVGQLFCVTAFSGTTARRAADLDGQVAQLAGEHSTQLDPIGHRSTPGVGAEFWNVVLVTRNRDLGHDGLMPKQGWWGAVVAGTETGSASRTGHPEEQAAQPILISSMRELRRSTDRKFAGQGLA
jgi:hypothetical protein